MSEYKSGFPVTAPRSGQTVEGLPSSAVAFVMESGFTYREQRPGELALTGGVLEQIIDVDASLRNSIAQARSVPLFGVEEHQARKG